MNSIEIVEIIVNAKSGADFGSSLKEAMLLAVKEWRNVQLTFNDFVYTIYVNQLLEQVQQTKK